MEQGCSWEADSHTSSQEIAHLLQNLKVYYQIVLIHFYDYVMSKPMLLVWTAEKIRNGLND
jgi:hypothetical protein